MKKEYVSPILDTQLVEFSGCIMAGSDATLPSPSGPSNPTPMPAPKKA